jgi:hypothetical protein
MPRVKLTKSVIDGLPTPAKDIVYWDSGCPGFGVKVTPAAGKSFSCGSGQEAQVPGCGSTQSALTVA